MALRIPPLLQPHLELPAEASLIVLTSVLGASTNWLVLRYLYSILHRHDDTGVVLVSFMREGAFWRDGGGKLGLDLDALSRTGRFSFVDGLTGLHASPAMRRVPGRVLQSDRVDDVKGQIEGAIGEVQPHGRVVLIVDAVDEWLATSGDEGMSSLAVEAMLLSLRESVHAAVVTLAADDPLMHSTTTALERSHAALVMAQAHAADAVLSLRLLDTGVARDVSGVIRISPRGTDGAGVEHLYHVGADGSVRVFERGA